MKNNLKLSKILTLFLGLGLFSSNLFSRVKVPELSVGSLKKQQGIINRGNLRDYVKSATYALNLAKRAFGRNQENAAIKIAGLNLFATMIENIKKVPRDATIQLL